MFRAKLMVLQMLSPGDLLTHSFLQPPKRWPILPNRADLLPGRTLLIAMFTFIAAAAIGVATYWYAKNRGANNKAAAIVTGVSAVGVLALSAIASTLFVPGLIVTGAAAGYYILKNKNQKALPPADG